MRVHVKHDGEFGPGPLPVASAFGSPLAEVGADVPRLEAGRVHRRHGCGVNQAAGSGEADHGSLNLDESPPASASARIRCEA